jgi:hypothetical protein
MSRTTMPEDCPICMAPAEQPLSAACGHTFCKSCIEKWGHHATSCPMCRRSMVEDKTKITAIMYNFFVPIYSFLVFSFISFVLEDVCVTKFAGEYEAQIAVVVAGATVALLAYIVKTYTRDFASRVHAQQRGLTLERLQWAYILFMCTVLAICFVPLFANWWSAMAVIGLVLMLPRAWDVCICFATFVLSVSFALPLQLKFIATSVLSVLTEFPVLTEFSVLCATSILPLLVNLIVATVLVLMVFLVQKCTYWVVNYYGHYVRDIDSLTPGKIVKNLACQVCIWVCQYGIYFYEWQLRRYKFSTEEVFKIRSEIEKGKSLIDSFTLISN